LFWHAGAWVAGRWDGKGDINIAIGMETQLGATKVMVNPGRELKNCHVSLQVESRLDNADNVRV
jgi:hypothetical protein